MESPHHRRCECQTCLPITPPFTHAQAVRASRQSLDDFDALNVMYLHEVQSQPLTRSAAVRKANREAFTYTDDAEELTRPQTGIERSFSIAATNGESVQHDYEDCVEDYAHPRPTTAPQVATDFFEPPPVHPADVHHVMRPMTTEQKSGARKESITNSQHSTGTKLKRWVKKVVPVIEKIILKEYDSPEPAPRPIREPKPLMIKQGDRQFINYHLHLKRNVSLETGNPHPAMKVISRQEALAKEQARKEAYEKLNSKAASVPTVPRAKRQVGHPDRDTLWEDFTTYVSPPSGNKAGTGTPPAAQPPPTPTRIPAHINKPTRKPVPLGLPVRQDSKDSDFEVERRESTDSQFFNMKPTDVFKPLPPTRGQESIRRKVGTQVKPVNELRGRVQSREASNGFRRPEQEADAVSEHGSFHTGYTFPDNPSVSPTSWPGTPADFRPAPLKIRRPASRLAPIKIPPTKDFIKTIAVTYTLKSAINRSLKVNRPLSASPQEEEVMVPTPAHPSDSTRDEIESLRNRLDEPFDANDNSPIVDIREHEMHRSVKVQHRVDQDTVESRYWREEREVMDPAEKVWRSMEVEVEMRGAGAKSSGRRDGRVRGTKGGFF